MNIYTATNKEQENVCFTEDCLDFVLSQHGRTPEGIES